MRAPVSFFSAGRLARLALLAPSLALAQNPPPTVFDFSGAADGAAPTAPLVYQAIAPRSAARTLPAQQLGAQDWRAANAAVGQFPRGHADLVAWEATEAKAGNAATVSAPPSTSAQHGVNPAMGHATPSHGDAHPHSPHPKGQP